MPVVPNGAKRLSIVAIDLSGGSFRVPPRDSQPRFEKRAATAESGPLGKGVAVAPQEVHDLRKQMMLKTSIVKSRPSSFTRMLPLLIVSLIGTSRLLDLPAFIYAELGAEPSFVNAATASQASIPEDYTDGYWDGLSDGEDGLPPEDVSSMSVDYQDGYAAGYAEGAPGGEDPHPDDYVAGYWDGETDGESGEPPADVTAQSPGYQSGYADGYAASVPSTPNV